MGGGGGGSKQLKIPPGVGLGRGVKFLIYFLEVGGGGGGGGRPTWKSLWLHPCTPIPSIVPNKVNFLAQIYALLIPKNVDTVTLHFHL